VIDAIDAGEGGEAFSIPTIALSAARSGGLLGVTIQAPSSFNIPGTWRFVILRDSGALRARIRPAIRQRQAQDHRRSLAGAVPAQTFKAWSKQPSATGPMPPSGGLILFGGLDGPLHEGRGSGFSADEAQRSIRSAMQTRCWPAYLSWVSELAR